VTPAELARLRADLAEARRRREELDYRWAVSKHTSSGTDNLDDLDVEVLGAEATILELQERLALAEGAAPAPPALAAANDTRPVDAEPEYVGTRDAARLLGISARTLEGLRLRGEGPPCIRIGRRVLYPLASLRTAGK
jgi:hypothetical protein